jgi:asparagine synthase (glutamine-hydrolysing)
MVAHRFQTDHTEYEVAAPELETALSDVLLHFDEPFGDSSAIPTGIVSRLAREKVRMVLTGDGGDEVLSGYTSYQGERFAADYQRVPARLTRGLPAVLSVAEQTVPTGLLRTRIQRARGVVAVSRGTFLDRLVQKTSWADPLTIKRLLHPVGHRIPIEDFLADRMSRCPYRDGFYRWMYFHLKVSLPDDMLTKVDRMSSAHGLETRTPFLDHRLVEYMVGVDKSLKLPGYRRKAILRDSVGKLLPRALLSAPKRGFAVPIGEWFRNEGFARHAKTLGHEDGLPFDPQVLRELIEENAGRRENHGNLLWIVMVARRFCRENG